MSSCSLRTALRKPKSLVATYMSRRSLSIGLAGVGRAFRRAVERAAVAMRAWSADIAEASCWAPDESARAPDKVAGPPRARNPGTVSRAATARIRIPGILRRARDLSRCLRVSPRALVPRDRRDQLGVLRIGFIGSRHLEADRAQQPFDLGADQLPLLHQRLGALVDGLAVDEHQPPVVDVRGAHDLGHGAPAGGVAEHGSLDGALLLHALDHLGA